MLFHGLLEQHAGVYVVQVSFSLIGDLNQDAFESAWNQLIHRHDPLRTAFVWEQVDQPLQVVGKKAALTINKLDWESKNIEKDRFKNPETIPDYQEWLSIDRMREFNFSSAPLMRVTQFRIAEDHHRVVWTYHHLLLGRLVAAFIVERMDHSLPNPVTDISSKTRKRDQWQKFALSVTTLPGCKARMTSKRNDFGNPILKDLPHPPRLESSGPRP